MAAVQPTDFFAGYEYVAAAGTVTANSIVIPLTALSGLLAAEADPATGDGREVARILIQSIAAAYNALPTAERPAFMSVVEPNLTPLSASRVRKGVNFTFDIDIPVTDLQMPTEV